MRTPFQSLFFFFFLQRNVRQIGKIDVTLDGKKHNWKFCSLVKTHCCLQLSLVFQISSPKVPFCERFKNYMFRQYKDWICQNEGSRAWIIDYTCVTISRNWGSFTLPRKQEQLKVIAYVAGFEDLVMVPWASWAVRPFRWYAAYIAIVIIIRTLGIRRTKRVLPSCGTFMLK